MQTLGFMLQLAGLVLLPMALVYYFYFSNAGMSEGRLMATELTMFGIGAGAFYVGHRITNRSRG